MRESSREKLWTLLLEAVFKDNVLPLTSHCNLSCQFCSHRQNPPGVLAYYFAPLPWEQLEELIPFLDPSRKIIIGESSTRLCEGEPFTHPLFMEILSALRQRFPQTPLQITTNGTYLRADNVKEIAALTRAESILEFIISLNSASAEHRAGIMGDNSLDAVKGGLALLRENGIGFHGSVVALPHLTGWDDLEQTLYFLDREGALSTRIFLPGYTSYAQPGLRFPSSLWEELDDFIMKIREKITHPLTLEPPINRDLAARVQGVFPSSAAYIAGLRTGDLILSVNGEKVLSGKDAFERLQQAADPSVEVLRDGEYTQDIEYIIPKKAGERTGLVFNADLDPHLITEVGKIGKGYGGSNCGGDGNSSGNGNSSNSSGNGNSKSSGDEVKSVLLLTSFLAAPLWQAARNSLLLPENIEISIVENRFFGGSICCAGLLTIEDFQAHLSEIIPHFSNTANSPPIVLVPPAPFDRKGFDLLGVHCRELSERFPEVSFLFL